ncbi:MAG TPA: glycosyltransferase family 4 protein [Candidatus Saccharimonadales bacterium]|nr:glycosyltransferase family 4 protein [Candidatus Saccharimonadales bacterium]
MRIALFHELDPRSGARKAANELTKVLQKRHIVDLYLVDQAKSSDEAAFYNRVYFYPFAVKKWHGKNWRAKLYKDSIELFKLYQLHKKIASDIRKRNYDVVFAHPSRFTQTPFLLRFPNTKKVYLTQDPHYRLIYEKVFALPKNVKGTRRIYEYVNRFIRKKIDRKNVIAADLLFANSLYSKKTIKKTYSLESKLVYLGVDAAFFTPAHVKKDIDVLYIGSKDIADGYDLLHKALKFIKRKPKTYEKLFENNWISDNQLRDLYRRAKIVVCLARDEPFGLIALEAGSCGVPVIAVNEGGYKETVNEGKTGYLIARNSKILAEKISHLLDNETLRAEMGRNARKVVAENWTWEKSAKRVEVLLKI